MSAGNVIVVNDAVHAFCDGACYSPETGIVQGFTSKIAKLPQIHAIATVVGHASTRIMIEDLVGGNGYSDFDDAAERFGADLRAQVNKHPQYWENGEFFTVLAGWSAHAHAPRAFMFTGCREGGHDGYIPRPVKKWFQPNNAAVQSIEFDEARVEDFGLRLLEAQRVEEWSPVYSSARFRAVGGFAEYTKLTQSEISTRVIHRWPDKIGEKINPNGGGAA